MSKKTNIPEVDAEGRPPEFVGVYAEQLDVILLKKWFKNGEEKVSTLKFSAKRLLAGTGGISGTIALEAISGTQETNAWILSLYDF